MSNTNLIEWEKEFDTKFHERKGWYEKNEPFDCWEAFDGLRDDIKSFIRSLLAQRDKELLQKAIEIAKKPAIFFGNKKFTKSEHEIAYEVGAQIVTNLEMELYKLITTKN